MTKTKNKTSGNNFFCDCEDGGIGTGGLLSITIFYNHHTLYAMLSVEKNYKNRKAVVRVNSVRQPLNCPAERTYLFPQPAQQSWIRSMGSTRTVMTSEKLPFRLPAKTVIFQSPGGRMIPSVYSLTVAPPFVFDLALSPIKSGERPA